MKRYKFAFDTILSLKEHNEELLKAEISKINSSYNKVKNKIISNNESKIKAQKDVGDAFDINLYRSRENYLKRFDYHNSLLKKDLKNMKQNKDEVNKKYQDAYQEAESFRRHKENKLKTYYKEENKKEDNILDEIGINQYIKKKIEEL